MAKEKFSNITYDTKNFKLNANLRSATLYLDLYIAGWDLAVKNNRIKEHIKNNSNFELIETEKLYCRIGKLD